MSKRTDAIERARERWNAGDLPGYLALYGEGIRLHGYTPEPMGKAEVEAFYRSTFAAFGSPQLVFDEVLESGQSITVRFTMTGTHVGDFMGVPPTRRTIALPGITILRFESDTVIERWSSADILGLLVQLGAMPGPG
ncbi:putative ester cyclase [Luteitalea pratensis]|uniref:Putative ester cyclase n=1 Tax=Luteitalea pratensis TaxID=1855912 RepID=A0A143PIV7_LUTPR|nr:ester cyclase [Luteitalea pratensis]AMY08441.1 putative ester cyclase [Luteitalea pratensis]